jgi:LacI family transcriptional regulator
MSKVILKDLAKALNVSISTVGRALSDSHEIGVETKKKVMQMAAEMGYNPNPYAGSLRSRKSKTIAIIVPELNNNFFIQAISGAESIAQEQDYHILIYVTNDIFEKEVSILNDLQNGRVDGVIMSLSATTTTFKHITDLIETGVNVVFFDRICHEIETAKIITDDFTSGFKATEHLIENKCKNIAFFAISDKLSIDNKRKQGYFEALTKYDLPIKNDIIANCIGNENDNFNTIKKILKTNKTIDGIFCTVEKLSLTTYHVCNELGIKIPNKIKIISFSNLTTAPLLNPSLTTITQPAFEMGMHAATLLFKHLSRKKSLIHNENIIMKSKLFIRESTTSQ